MDIEQMRKVLTDILVVGRVFAKNQKSRDVGPNLGENIKLCPVNCSTYAYSKYWRTFSTADKLFKKTSSNSVHTTL